MILKRRNEMKTHKARMINFFLLSLLIALLTAMASGVSAYAASDSEAFSASAPEAAPGTLRDFFIAGKVTAPDGKPLENVEVILTGAANRDTLTKADGSYSFDLLQKGTYTVSPRKAGMKFTPKNSKVSIKGDNKSEVDFKKTQ
jgi:hypothetical protein